MSIIDRDECVCRMGGDNFAAYIRRDHLDEIIGILHSFSVSRLESAPNRTFELSAWIGISGGLPDHDPRPFSARLNEASTACNVGKSRLKQSVVFFSEELKMMMNRGREIMAMFYPAVKNREFHPFFQAKVDMRTGELVGFEALCRWIHEGRFIFPDQFIPIAEQTGHIHTLSLIILNKTCAAIRSMLERGYDIQRISVNFSTLDVRYDSFCSDVQQIISRNQIPFTKVAIEITESRSEADFNIMKSKVLELQKLGIKFYLDDFGTGYSNFERIMEIPFDIIKFDRSMTIECAKNETSFYMVSTFANMFSQLHYAVLFEGIENDMDELNCVRMSAKYLQGYKYSKPIPIEELANFLVARQAS